MRTSTAVFLVAAVATPAFAAGPPDPDCVVGECQCKDGAVAVTTPAAFFPRDPAKLTYAWWDAFWANLDDPQAPFWQADGYPGFNRQAVRRFGEFDPYTFAFEKDYRPDLNPYFPMHWQTGAMAAGDPSADPFTAVPFEQVKHPARFAPEPIADHAAQAWVVEVTRPAGDFEIPNFYTGVAQTEVHLRGWYIRGDRAAGEPGALAVIYPGRGDEITAPELSLRDVAARLVQEGFDVWMPDLRGHGVSDGICSEDNLAMARDVFESLTQFETGEGVRAVDANGSAYTGPLLPYATAAETPLLLVGDSGGEMAILKAMTLWTLAREGPLETVDGPVDFRSYFGDGVLDASYYAAFDVRGVVSIDGFEGIEQADGRVFGLAAQDRSEWIMEDYAAAPQGVAFPPGIQTGTDAVGFVGQQYWPAHLQVHGLTDGFTPPLNVIDSYNAERGIKQVILAVGDHGILDENPDVRPKVYDAIAKFAHDAMASDGAMNNRARTTLREEACRAAKMKP